MTSIPRVAIPSERPRVHAPHEPAVRVRLLEKLDVAEADRVMRLAFGTFLGLPEPSRFLGDASFVRPRWLADPTRAFCALRDGELLGSNFATRWGSFGFFGPLTVRPDCWALGLGKQLMEPIMTLLDDRGVRLAGLFTFPSSPKHVGLYQRYGFHPRFLTAVLAQDLTPAEREPPPVLFSAFGPSEKAGCLRASAELTDRIWDGLDVRSEIESIDRLGLGDTVLLFNGSRLEGFAACHTGAGTEAGSGACFVKFAAVSPGPRAGACLERLLDGCRSFALSRGATRIVAGCNTAREEAYGRMLARGFRVEFLGIAMHRPSVPGFSRPDAFVLDDWR